MKFVIVGAGALGSILAAHLARAGTPVALVARGRRADQIEADGVRLTGIAEFSAQVPVIRPGGTPIDGDVVVLCVKTFDTETALAPLRFSGSPVALSLQNGVLKNEELARHFGAGQVLGAAASISGELLADGATRFTMNERLPIGEPGGPRSPRVEAVASALKDAGIAAVAVDGIDTVEWTKYTAFVPMFAAALLMRQETWRNLADPQSSIAIARLMRETAALAAASGVQLDDQGGLPVASIAAAPPEEGAAIVRKVGEAMRVRAPQHRVSALQDLLRGGRVEVDAILGHAVRLGRHLNVHTPTIETCYQFCAALGDPREQ